MTWRLLGPSLETGVTHTIGGCVGRAKDAVVGKAKKFVGDATDVVKDGASKDFDIIDSSKRIGEDIARNASGKIEESVEKVKEKAKELTVKNVQEIGQKSLNGILGKLKEVAYDVIRYMLYRDKTGSIGSIVGLIHMLGFSTAYGMCVWVTFVSSYVLGRYLSRRLFGMVQSRIYPVYFKAMACCVSVALLGHLASRKTEILTSKMGMFQSLCLGSALLMVLTNMILLEPKATKVK